MGRPSMEASSQGDKIPETKVTTTDVRQQESDQQETVITSYVSTYTD